MAIFELSTYRDDETMEDPPRKRYVGTADCADESANTDFQLHGETEMYVTGFCDSEEDALREARELVLSQHPDAVFGKMYE